MENPPSELTGPDLAAGIRFDSLAPGAMLQGHAHGVAVLLVRRGDTVVAVGAFCTHYGAPLVDGIVDGETVRCPLHHACFNLHTGDALHAPAFDPLPRWAVEQRDGMVYVRDALAPAAAVAPREDTKASRMVIVGGGAAGDAAAGMLRKEGYAGTITIVSADQYAPGDRPNYSKGTIAGTVSMDFNFVRPSGFYEANDIELRLGTTVTSIDTAQHTMQLSDGTTMSFDALLLATGAEPIRLTVPGAELPHVHALRTLSDSLAIAEHAKSARTAVVIGASFIGLEVAAALRSLNVTVHVVAPDDIPMARVLGRDVGIFVQHVHEQHGVTFHLGTTVTAIDASHVTLADGSVIDADLVIAGIGVRPAVALAEQAGLAVENGVLVNSRLQTSVDGIYAAGDIARWMDDTTGKRTRVEHWAVAQRQGQTAARNMLGRDEPFEAVPFFWSEHYDVTIMYVGHAEKGFTTELSGSFETTPPQVRVHYLEDGRLTAVATIGRDVESLEAELQFERTRHAG